MSNAADTHRCRHNAAQTDTVSVRFTMRTIAPDEKMVELLQGYTIVLLQNRRKTSSYLSSSPVAHSRAGLSRLLQSSCACELTLSIEAAYVVPARDP